jgi:DNA (cytosine-5)-methyltransferase 1
VFIVGFISDLGCKWTPPETTHSEEMLLRSKWIERDYWIRHEVPEAEIPPIGREKSKVDRLRTKGEHLFEPRKRPWRTVRDALADLPDPRDPEASGVPDHEFSDGAKAYPGHTGSPLDRPSKTLKAGDHGVPGGENMIAYYDDSVRYFTVREAARIQTFPDEYLFNTAWTVGMKQLGNAVPVKLAEAVVGSVKRQLHSSSQSP